MKAGHLLRGSAQKNWQRRIRNESKKVNGGGGAE